VFAATASGLYRSSNSGESWTKLSIPTDEAWCVAATKNALYAGTAPAHLYRSDDGGASWKEVSSLRRQLTQQQWTAPVGDPRLRTLGTYRDAPGLIIVGIKAGGLHVSQDNGETWFTCTGLPDDIHHVFVRRPEEFIASTGYLSMDGTETAELHRTQDAGRTWIRIDPDENAYFRSATEYDGRLYASAARGSPPTWAGNADGTLFEGHMGETLASVSYPGGPKTVVDTLSVVAGRIVAGTTFKPENTNSIDMATAAGSRGNVLYRAESGEWQQAGEVPAGIHSIASV
jgi:hypothetical protein